MRGLLYKEIFLDHVGACRGTFSKIQMEILLTNVSLDLPRGGLRPRNPPRYSRGAPPPEHPGKGFAGPGIPPDVENIESALDVAIG